MSDVTNVPDYLQPNQIDDTPSDISKIVPFAISKPEEAVKNIDNSQVYSMDPTTYKDYAVDLDPHIEEMAKPQETTPGLGRYIAQSSEHAAAAIPDNTNLSWVEREMKAISDHVYERPNTAKQIIDLSNKKMNDPANFTDDDEYNLLAANQKQQQLGQKDYGLNILSQLPVKVAEIGSDIARSVGSEETLNWVRRLSKVNPILALGVGTAMDAYKNASGAFYNEQSNRVDAEGKPIVLDEDTKKYTAKGVGVVAAGIQTAMNVSGFKITPLMNEFLKPTVGAIITKSPLMAAAFKSAMIIGEQYAVGFAGGAGNETAKVIGEEFAKYHDGTDESFLNALTAIANDAPRILKAGNESGLVQGAVAGVGTAIGFGATRRRYQTAADAFNEARNAAYARDVSTPKELSGSVASGERDVTPRPPPPELPTGSIKQAQNVLLVQEAAENMGKVLDQTNLSKVSPTQLGEVTKSMAAQAGMGKFWFGWQDLKDKIKDPARLEKIKNDLDPSGATTENTPLGMGPHQFFELQKEFPELKDIIRLDPEGPTPLQAEEYLKNLDEAKGIREKVLNNIATENKTAGLPQGEVNVKEQTAAEQAKTEQAIKDAQQALLPIKGVGDLQAGVDWHGDSLLQTAEEYLNSNTFTKPIEGVLSEDEIKKYNDAQLAARTDVHAQIMDAANEDMLKVQDVVIENTIEEQHRIEIDRIANNSNYALVDKFQRYVIKNGKTKQGESLYAIDPKLLPEKLYTKYAKSNRLKKYGVFKAGGISADDAATMLGVQDGKTLLNILDKTPTREEVVQARMSARREQIEMDARNSVDLNETKISKAFNNQTLVHLNEMKFMKDKEWSSTKSGIKRIALPLPKIEELQLRAKEVVNRTTVGDLNISQYKVGERRSQREAINAILKNEVERAFMNKENAALNSELQKATAIAIGKVNRGFDYARRFKTPEFIRLMKDAGPAFEKAATEILDVFNLDPSKKGLSIQDSFQKWVKKMFDQGRGDFSINPELSDIRQSAYDMPTEQFLTVIDRLKQIEFQARELNKLNMAEEKLIEEQTFEQYKQTTVNLFEVHPDYNTKKLPEVQEVSRWKEIKGKLMTAKTSLAGMKHIILTLDKEQPGQFFYKTLVEPLTGEGDFKNKQGFSGKIEDQVAIMDHFQKSIEQHLSTEEFADLHNTWLDIPEFKNLREWNNGVITKANLLKAYMHIGDPDGRTALEQNMSTSLHTLQKVAERYLDNKHIEFMTNFYTKGLQSYKARIVRLEKETKGRDVKWIEGVPFTFKGVAYPGGKVKLRYRIDYDDKAIEKAQQVTEEGMSTILGDKENESGSIDYTSQYTDQGYLKERVGSNKPLDISFHNVYRDFEEIIHDLNYRKPTMDIYKIVKDKDFKKAMIATVGIDKYRIYYNSVIEIANEMEVYNNNYFADHTKLFTDVAGNLKAGFSLARIGGNISSFLIQGASLPITLQKMGAITGTKHLLLTIGEMLDDPLSIPAMMEQAAEVDPTLKQQHREVIDNITTTFREAFPTKRLLHGVPVLDPLERAKNALGQKAMSIVGIADELIKTVMSRSLFRQFMDGDAPGFPIKDVMAMSPEERVRRASSYANQMSELTLTRSNKALDKSPFEKAPTAWMVNWFILDARQVVNSFASEGRKIKWNFKAGNYAKAAGGVLSVFVMYTIMRLIEDTVRKQPTPFDHKHDWSTLKGQWEGAKDYASYAAFAPADVYFTAMPFTRDINYAVNVNPSNQNKVIKKTTTPFDAVMTATATSYSMLQDFLFAHRMKFSDAEMKQFLYMASYALQFPMRGLEKLDISGQFKKFMDGLKNNNPSPDQQGSAENLQEEIKKYQADHPPDTDPKFLEQLAELDKQLGTSQALVPENTQEVIKKIASEGDWSKVDKETGAAGTYQYTADAWKNVMDNAPELGLTEEGRVAKDQTQQEVAMQWELENNARQLQSKEIPVDQETLYAAHLLGVNDAVKLYEQAGDTKTKGILKSNKEIANFKTIGQVRKFIKSQVNANKLTLAGKTKED